MKLRTVTRAAVLALLLSATASIGVADASGGPANPGCFGDGRSDFAKQFGGQMVAFYTSMRAGDNGSINRAYMASCGGQP